VIARLRALSHICRILPPEQDPEDWWQKTVANIRQMLVETGVSPGDIAGISLSGQGCACQPVSLQGEPLGRAMIWTDERAAGEQTRIREIFGAELGKITGMTSTTNRNRA
jgi:xylulokinase